ncbi:MFS transporter [Pedobacter insulae]|uniref:MFS transporter, OPA family, sugar phosphate sensor protein UhpC n=1 Tax=Pedobacter insulae TaxID=414048 RepID=A0A1I3A7S2_9SPHI|nr:MFS transporter [Pedobacter insulae]SFH45769.1 MFS transporter, OPA family, sugar phosphate sensor protein UhpC [Pedobacter insulae]
MDHNVNQGQPLTDATSSKKFKYWQVRTIIATMVGYAIFYFVRKNFSFAIPGLTAEYGITKTSFGIIMTLVTIVYGISRFLNGILADRMNARYHMSIGLFLCAVANFAFGWGADLSSLFTGQTGGPMFTNTMVLIFGVILILNNFIQGSGFPPVARLLTHWIPQNELATKMSVWNTSHSIGAALVAILAGYIMGTLGTDMSANPEIVNSIAANLKINVNDADKMKSVIESATHYGAWRWCFWIPAAIALAGSIGLFITLRDTPSSVDLPELHKTYKKGRESSAEFKAFLRKSVYRNKWIWILGIANFFVYVVRFAVLDWGPTFLKEAHGMTLSNAGWTVAVFEIFGILGMLAAGWATDKYFAGKAHRTSLYCMVGVAIFMTIFLYLPDSSPQWIMISVLAMAGFFIYGPQALIGIAAANQATNRAAATANGLTGLFGYASGLVSGVGVGYMVDSINKVNPGKAWDYVFMMMIGMALAGVLIFALMWKAKAHGYDELEN